MPIVKQVVTDRVEVLEDGSLQVREATRIVEDGVILAETYHRYVLAPGESTSGKSQRVVDVANAVHKPDVVASFNAKKAKP